MFKERRRKFKAWNEHRGKIADENMLAMVRALDAVRSENTRRREAKRLARRLAKQSGANTSWLATCNERLSPAASKRSSARARVL